MAKAQKKATDEKAKTNGSILDQLGASVVSDEDMESELKEARGGKGGRTSKYGPIAEFAEKNVTENKPLRLEGGMTEVSGLRGYLDRNYGDKYTVTSASKKGEKDKYIIYVRLTTQEEKDAAAAKAAKEASKSRDPNWKRSNKKGSASRHPLFLFTHL